MSIKFNEDLIEINGKKFFVFSRNNYPLALAFRYNGYYHHESLASGAFNWFYSLPEVGEIIYSHVLNKHNNKGLQRIKKLLIDEQLNQLAV